MPASFSCFAIEISRPWYPSKEPTWITDDTGGVSSLTVRQRRPRVANLSPTLSLANASLFRSPPPSPQAD